MTTEKMKKAIGMYRRTGVNIWQWKIKAPKDLRHLYSSDWAENCSLGTPDFKEASRKATQLRLDWLERFEVQRAQLNPLKVPAITPAMAQFFAEQALHSSLAEDQNRRTKPEDQAWLLRWMQAMEMPGADVAPSQFAGMPEGLADMLDDLHTKHDAEAGKALARGDRRKALLGMQHVAAKAGIAFDMHTPGLEEASQEYLRAIRKATSLTVQRDQGEIVDTPPAPDLKAIEAAKKPRKLRDVFARWKESKHRKEDTIAATERALAMFEQQTGNPPLEQITRSMGDTFRAWLLKEKLASSTKSDRLTAIQGLLNYASRDLEWLPKNPWAGFNIESRTENKRKPWSPEELKTFFSQPLFTQYELPTKQWRSGKDAAYWIPLLGLFTGARIGELCQLRVEDIVSTDGQALISINDDAEGSTVKTQAGLREIPLHSELERLGFLEYVEATRLAGHDRLWPDLRLRDGKAGGYFSTWFGEARKMGGSERVVPDFHSFRHTARTKMTEARIAEQVQDRITGHEVSGSVGTKVYGHLPMSMLREAVESITYPGLVLQKVYKHQ